MTKSIPNDTKLVLLTKKLEMWQNTLYDAQLDAEIAKMLDDEPLSEQSQARMKAALKTIEWVEGRLGELTGGE